MPTDPLGNALLTIARNAIGAHFGLDTHPVAHFPNLDKPAATFVTLTQDGQLRGCIGSLEAHRSLAQDTSENARAAAFRDPRFPPLRSSELERTRIEVSLLDTPEDLPCSDESEAIARLRPEVDGLILTCGNRRATFLPQVWESLHTPRLFLEHLKLKAGLPANFWSSQVKLSRYGVKKWKEPAE